MVKLFIIIRECLVRLTGTLLKNRGIYYKREEVKRIKLKKIRLGQILKGNSCYGIINEDDLLHDIKLQLIQQSLTKKEKQLNKHCAKATDV